MHQAAGLLSPAKSEAMFPAFPRTSTPSRSSRLPSAGLAAFTSAALERTRNQEMNSDETMREEDHRHAISSSGTPGRSGPLRHRFEGSREQAARGDCRLSPPAALGLVDRMRSADSRSRTAARLISIRTISRSTRRNTSTRPITPAIHLAASASRPGRSRGQSKAQAADGRIRTSTALCDGRASWGHHLSVSVDRAYFDALFGRKPHLLGALATHLATATIFTGGGKVGSGNHRETCDFQLAQRADWFEELVGQQTMTARPLVNARDESHATAGLARLHIIFFDNTLAPTCRYLMAGTTQLICAMGEAGWIDPNLHLDDPVAAALDISRDLKLRHRQRWRGAG